MGACGSLPNQDTKPSVQGCILFHCLMHPCELCQDLGFSLSVLIYFLSMRRLLRITMKCRVGDRKDKGLTPPIRTHCGHRPAFRTRQGGRRLGLGGHYCPWAVLPRTRNPSLLMLEKQMGGGWEQDPLCWLQIPQGSAKTTRTAAQSAALWCHPTVL